MSLLGLVENGHITVASDGAVYLTPRAWRRMTCGGKPPMALHFVGFKDDRVYSALAVFGPPDFWHRWWDHRAVAEIAPGDVVVFADGDETDVPREFAFDDSAMQ